MPGISDVSYIWRNIRELDLRPIRESAEQGLTIALVGAPGSGRRLLADQMRQDPARPEVRSQTPVLIAGLEDIAAVAAADLVILVFDAAAQNTGREQAIARDLANSGKKALVFAVQPGAALQKEAALKQGAGSEARTRPENQAAGVWPGGKGVRFVSASPSEATSLLPQFVPAVIDLLPDRLLALGRQFPLFRMAIAHQLIHDTCFSNAAYTLSTGIAEVVPIFDVPLNIADLIVLTKAQAFLVYKLGLVFGFSTRWQDYMAEFGSVIGGGFLWRQTARFLVGLIPVWGIVPKVAVAYSGTYVVGNAVLQWYLTGRHLTRKQMRELSVQAFARGKALARGLLDRARRAKPGRGKGKKALPGPLPAAEAARACPFCGKSSAGDAAFCQYCGQRLAPVG